VILFVRGAAREGYRLESGVERCLPSVNDSQSSPACPISDGGPSPRGRAGLRHDLPEAAGQDLPGGERGRKCQSYLTYFTTNVGLSRVRLGSDLFFVPPHRPSSLAVRASPTTCAVFSLLPSSCSGIGPTTRTAC
jgi:hypothetical protein